MFVQKVEVKIKAMTKPEAQEKAKLAAAIANSVDTDALKILSVAAARPGATQKVKNFKGMLESM